MVSRDIERLGVSDRGCTADLNDGRAAVITPQT